ncbi:MAG TPA: putative toxin-antitoxin system toxin component, PIN family [Terriglobales bacterium]|nr:putative toxin-antitoxin system toxin component, PIN family [Terriglobales bacterium]
MRCVIDTNVLVSAAAFSPSIPRQAVMQVLKHCLLLLSESTVDELKEILLRTKFDRYVSQDERALFLVQLTSAAEFVPIIRLVRECRDPKDDKFLELALNGRTDAIITGDGDLLRMHPWRGVKILSPGDYLKRS